jgi:hypothetical protein
LYNTYLSQHDKQAKEHTRSGGLGISVGELKSQGPAVSVIETTKRIRIKKEEKICPKNWPSPS